MTAAGVAWSAFTVFAVALGVRVALSEAVWPSYRVEPRPRRVVRALDVLAAVALTLLVAALAAVIGPPVLAR